VCLLCRPACSSQIATIRDRLHASRQRPEEKTGISRRACRHQSRRSNLSPSIGASCAIAPDDVASPLVARRPPGQASDPFYLMPVPHRASCGRCKSSVSGKSSVSAQEDHAPRLKDATSPLSPPACTTLNGPEPYKNLLLMKV
jgi:hypothetical protein